MKIATKLKESREALAARRTANNEARTAADAANDVLYAAGEDATSEQIEAVTRARAEERSSEIALRVAESQVEIYESVVEEFESGRITGGRPRDEDDHNNGFAHLGEFIACVIQAEKTGDLDPRLIEMRNRIRASGATTDVGSEAGFAVPLGFSAEIAYDAVTNNSFLQYADVDPVTGNGMVYPRDESPAAGTGSVVARWKAEGVAGILDNPKIGSLTLQLKDLFAFAELSNDLIEDSVALGSHVRRAAPVAIGFRVDQAMVRGTGGGEPLGYRGGDGEIIVAKESGQADFTIVIENIAQMYSRAIFPSRTRWLMAHEAMPQIMTLTLSNQPMFIPPGGAPNAPNGTLWGRPIDLSDQAQVLGTAGDLSLCDWSGYKANVKSAGIQLAESMHVRFLEDNNVLRWKMRVDGAPWRINPYDPGNSLQTRGHFVTLGDRKP